MPVEIREYNDKWDVSLVGGYKVICVREATVTVRDGVEISRATHRRTVYPDADLAQEPADVRAVAEAVFTQEVKDAYSTSLNL